MTVATETAWPLTKEADLVNRKEKTIIHGVYLDMMKRVWHLMRRMKEPQPEELPQRVVKLIEAHDRK